MTDAIDRKALFVETIRRAAQWRRSVYEDMTEDGPPTWVAKNNLVSAAALRFFANWVSELEDDDPDLGFLRKAEIGRDGESIYLHTDALRILGRLWVNKEDRKGIATPTETQMRKLLRRISGAEKAYRSSVGTEMAQPLTGTPDDPADPSAQEASQK